MSGGITVKEFKYIPGKNDAEYIKLLEEHNERWKQIANSAISKLKRMSAERPKHGEWEYIDFDLYSSCREIKCSCCGEEYVVDAPLYRIRAWDIEDLKYCPNCGAKMEVERK